MSSRQGGCGRGGKVSPFRSNLFVLPNHVSVNGIVVDMGAAQTSVFAAWIYDPRNGWLWYRMCKLWTYTIWNPHKPSKPAWSYRSWTCDLAIFTHKSKCKFSVDFRCQILLTHKLALDCATIRIVLPTHWIISRMMSFQCGRRLGVHYITLRY
jgi:hypothetical protein